ncbi:MAG: ribonuclease HII [Flavobacteriaceae bacterium]|nr:ribonuclease HII [Flavobacteriaceae bacterium]
MLKNRFSKSEFEVGIDEAGRGCIAGPVTASAVILPKGFNNKYLDDSKKLSEKKRLELKIIIEKEAVDYSVFFINAKIIDKINILNSTFKAMHGALNNLKTQPNFILVDGNKFIQYNDIPHKCIIKGDGKYQNIAAASILAKTYRDEYMKKLHSKYPEFGWNTNKGYGTKFHMDMINKYGKTDFHRKSFNIKKLQLKIQYQ